ncbi:MAG: hypothetical protein E3J44_00845 [Candidatus Aminicenantes bacterium]|nr:MAG: hypothetical protein E3J44_00845 [Candidatus Aminicenantes bacterium]
MHFFLLSVGIIYPSGGPISPHLLRYRAFAVKNHSRIPCASHLRQTRSVNNPGLYILPFTLSNLKFFSWIILAKNRWLNLFIFSRENRKPINRVTYLNRSR